MSRSHLNVARIDAVLAVLEEFLAGDTSDDGLRDTGIAAGQSPGRFVQRVADGRAALLDLREHHIAQRAKRETRAARAARHAETIRNGIATVRARRFIAAEYGTGEA